MATQKLKEMLRKNGVVHPDGTDLTDAEIKKYFDGVFKKTGIKVTDKKKKGGK